MPDTIKVTDELVASGFTDRQARAIVRAHAVTHADFVFKSELGEVKSAFDNVETAFDNLVARVDKLELWTKIFVAETVALFVYTFFLR